MDIDEDRAFYQRFLIKPKSAEIRNRIIEISNVQDFFIEQSCIVPYELGLFANKRFKKGDFLGTYRGELCLIDDLSNAFSDVNKYDLFLKKYNITTKLTRNETCCLMEKMGFAISDKEFLVMPKYPIEPIFYQTYNAMLYVNEPSAYCDSNRNCEKMSDADPVLNKHLKAVGNQHLKSNQECNVNPQGNQQCKINVLAYTNFKWKTIDYIAATDIVKNSELLVYYGNQYNRSSYNIIK